MAWLEAAGVDEGETCDAAMRVDLVERLALIGQPWCIDALRAASRDERTPTVRKAIKAALNIPGPDL
ncbi:MAG TPA: hypothetical protein VFE36_11305 [Candidatus Baltobacteraceae bacterium]|nr:hypothetical protein [Candidatus Baltobacteraceae bacterium]